MVQTKQAFKGSSFGSSKIRGEGLVFQRRKVRARVYVETIWTMYKSCKKLRPLEGTVKQNIVRLILHPSSHPSQTSTSLLRLRPAKFRKNTHVHTLYNVHGLFSSSIAAGSYSDAGTKFRCDAMALKAGTGILNFQLLAYTSAGWDASRTSGGTLARDVVSRIAEAVLYACRRREY